MEELYSAQQLEKIYDSVKTSFEKLRPQVIQQGEGYLKYPYLIPAGFYKQMWDWDGFFMGIHFVSIGQPEYLKYWALNLIEGIDEKGYVAGCATTNGPRPIFGDFPMKPFLSQGVLFASQGLNDFDWVKPHYENLTKVLAYREQTQQDQNTGLFYWQNAMQSGADNNVALNYFPDDPRSFLACDASTFQLKEYLAQSILAEKLDKTDDSKYFAGKAETLKQAINRYLWCEEDQMFYNVDRETGTFYKRISYSCFIPLIEEIAPQDKGRKMIECYLLNPKHMKSEYGLRSLSLQDPDYNNKNIIIPFSNWQGPVWPIANYLYSIGLQNYGFEKELQWLTGTIGELVLKDIELCGSMHENYHAETGDGLAPSAEDVSANGRNAGFISWNLCVQNILQGVVENKPTLLKLN